FSKSDSASPDTTAARWTTRSGRFSIRRSASSGAATSAETISACPSGLAGATTSTRVNRSIPRPPTLPSATRRCTSLRPIIPAAPTISTCMRHPSPRSIEPVAWHGSGRRRSSGSGHGEGHGLAAWGWTPTRRVRMVTLWPVGRKVIRNGFFRDSDLDFQARGALGRAVRGSSEVGEVLATLARIRNQSGWAREWAVTARRAQTEADRARDAGHLVSASSGYLRAATYWASVVDGLATLGTSLRLGDAFRIHRRCWDSFVDCSGGAHLPLSVPYESTTLPGYLLRPDASGRARPTLVVTNGSDGAVSDLWTSAVAGALARDWNAFVYDGPGQQSMLFERETYFRPDWEAVLTPVIDLLAARADVDAARMTGYGISQGGYRLPRALAFE